LSGDRIFVENLVVSCRVGITEKERSRRQAVILDLHIFRDLREAGISDDRGKTSDYAALRESVFELVSRGEFKLLESIAEKVASRLLEGAAVSQVNVKIRKKKYSTSPNIGIEITRTRHG